MLKPLRLISAGICSSYGVSKFISRCEKEDDQQQNINIHHSQKEKCEEYNSIFQRLSFAERSNRCIAEVGCRFDGGHISGSCLSIIEDDDNNNIHNNHHHQTIDSKASITTTIKSEGDHHDNHLHIDTDAESDTTEQLNSEEGNESEMYSIDPEDFASEVDLKDLPSYLEILESTASKKIHGIINEQIAAQASGQLNSSKEILFDTVKSSILDSFYVKENPKLFGELLETILGYDQVRDNTRALVYWSIQTDDVIKNSKSLSKHNIQYFVTGEAKEISRRQVAELFSWFLKHPDTPATVLKPQLDWYVAQSSTTDSLSSALASTLKATATQVI